MLKSYLRYRKSRNVAHGIHSPFVFEFYNKVLLRANEIDDSRIQNLRKDLLKDRSSVEFLDLGAGSKKHNESKRVIAEIAKTSGINRKYGKLLSKIVDFYRIETCLELGTSLGIGTSYLALSSTVKKAITLEGVPRIAQIARQNFDKLELNNIDLIEGDFKDTLETAIRSFEKLDLIYVDGNHTYQATMDYFNSLMEKAHDETILIFDDIHWSKEMEKAWEEITDSPKVNVTIDLFRMGIVIKRKQQAKEHFVLKY